MSSLPWPVTLPDSDVPYDRNLIAGTWVFPAMPYDIEIRSPADSSVLATVPLSSRLDVDRAVRAARPAASDWHAYGGTTRLDVLRHVVAALDRARGRLAQLVAAETGLEPADSTRAVDDVLCWATVTLNRGVPGEAPAAGVSGHILSWGLPFAEVITSLLPQLARGYAVVAKPSLRAPLSAAAFAHAAAGAGIPPGVLNIVQGAGLDAGAALLANPHLARLEVRGNRRTRIAGHRAVARRAVAYHALAGSGNVTIIGAAADDRIVHLAAAQIADAARVHSAGGPLALPVVAVHRTVADDVIRAVLDAVAGHRPAPLPAQSLRNLALGTLDSLRRSGASLLCGGHLPDDALHRMGWTFPATVLSIGSIANLDVAEPLGPVLRMATWETTGELVASLRQERHRDGIACLWGLDDELAADLGAPRPGEHSTPDEAAEHDEAAAGAPRRGLLLHRTILRDGGPHAALREATLPPAAPC